MKATIWIVASVIAFLVAAKVHGRELRFERQAAGYHHVVFGGTNPPFVEALWKRERVRFWGAVIVLAAAAAIVVRRQGAAAIALVTLVWVPTIVFLALGAMSHVRRT